MQTKELILKNCDIPTVPLVAVKIFHLVKDYNSDVNNPLCCIVALADALCLRLGVGYRGPMADIDLMDVKWREILKISNTQFSQLMELFKQAYIEEKLLYQE